jgi:ribonuclease HII
LSSPPCSAVVDEGTIDRINILQAALLAMRTSVEGLAGAGLKPDYVLIDGNKWVWVCGDTG